VNYYDYFHFILLFAYRTTKATGPHLYEFAPSGTAYEFYAMSIGARSQSAKTYLERHFEEFADCPFLPLHPPPGRNGSLLSLPPYFRRLGHIDSAWAESAARDSTARQGADDFEYFHCTKAFTSLSCATFRLTPFHRFHRIFRASSVPGSRTRRSSSRHSTLPLLRLVNPGWRARQPCPRRSPTLSL
jgi:hypothetical protein